jgi:hypothetical protein
MGSWWLAPQAMFSSPGQRLTRGDWHQWFMLIHERKGSFVFCLSLDDAVCASTWKWHNGAFVFFEQIIVLFFCPFYGRLLGD